MSEPGTDASAAKAAPNAAPNPGPQPAAAIGPNPASKMFTELKVSAHLMTFDTGLYCIVQTPGARRPDDGTGLPGVRVSLPPNSATRPDSVSFATFRPDGWLSGLADALLVRVAAGPSQILVTIYQAPTGGDTAPRLQVLRLSDEQAMPGNAAVPPPGAPGGLLPRMGMGVPGGIIPEVVVHAQLKGDVGANFGDWVGDKGSKRWIEGFMLNPRAPLANADIEYQAVLGRGWLSPWVEGGQLCGSRGMALPVLGLRIRLRGAAAESHELEYAATFVDGTKIGPVKAGEPCEAESLSPLEAFQIVLLPRLGAKPAVVAAETDKAEEPKPRSTRGKPAAPAKKR